MEFSEQPPDPKKHNQEFRRRHLKLNKSEEKFPCVEIDDKPVPFESFDANGIQLNRLHRLVENQKVAGITNL